MIVNGRNAGKKEEEDPSPASLRYHRPVGGRNVDVHVFDHVGGRHVGEHALHAAMKDKNRCYNDLFYPA